APSLESWQTVATDSGNNISPSDFYVDARDRVWGHFEAGWARLDPTTLRWSAPDNLPDAIAAEQAVLSASGAQRWIRTAAGIVLREAPPSAAAPLDTAWRGDGTLEFSQALAAIPI